MDKILTFFYFFKKITSPVETEYLQSMKSENIRPTELGKSKSVENITWNICNFLKSEEVLTLSDYVTFQFWRFPILTLSNSDTFQLWHFPILTLSDSNTFRFWHFFYSDNVMFKGYCYMDSLKSVPLLTSVPCPG